MNILFIGQYYPPCLITTFINNSKVSLDFAANNLQEAIFQGFFENSTNIDILNAPHLGSFPPYYKTPFIPSYKSDIEGINSFSYLNISYLKRWDIQRKIRKGILKWCRKTIGYKIIFFYNFTALSVIREIKEKFQDVKICLLVTDLPEFMSADNYLITRINRRISSLFESNDKSYFDFVDGYVLLAPAMRERLPMKNKPWLQIEGIYNPKDDQVKVQKDNEKIILYTGNLGKRYGILDLLEAFYKTSNSNYRLWICGTGDGLDDVIKYQTKDIRIQYLGLKSRKQVIELQKRATLLINPRHRVDEYTKYSFPSKTMEYMASGTPTLMSHLESIPREYDDHLFYFDNESIDGMKTKIEEICEMQEHILQKFGYEASLFIQKEKCPKVQVGKIINFLKTL